MSITISPEGPTTATTVTFTFTGANGCQSTEQAIEGNEFIFEVGTLPGPCLSAPVPYSFTWRVGPLEAGPYRVTLVDSGSGTTSESFEVSQALSGNPQSIPTLGFVGAATLVTLMAVVAIRFLRRVGVSHGGPPLP